MEAVIPSQPTEQLIEVNALRSMYVIGLGNSLRRKCDSGGHSNELIVIINDHGVVVILSYIQLEKVQQSMTFGDCSKGEAVMK